jgi:Ca2+-transporting ATPase
LLRTGDRVAADGRLLEQINLMADESVLTGESASVQKELVPIISEEIAEADRKWMIFAGTVITYGRGRAVITATGMNTEFGRIARLLSEVKEEKTPLEVRMATIGRTLSIICLVVAAGATLLGVIRAHGWLEMLIWGVSLAVAAVPEALPAVVTGALAIGTTRMARKNAIVRRLPAVETMGCTTVICTDKTGTLTKNEMKVRRLFLDGREVEVGCTGYRSAGVLPVYIHELSEKLDQVLDIAARIAFLCNDASLEVEENAWIIRGDPTEGALLAMGLELGMDYGRRDLDFPRLAEIPFSAERKMMTTIHRGGGGIWAYMKGAPEILLSRSKFILTGQGEKPLPEPARQELISQAGKKAGEALRVLALAYRPLETLPDPPLEKVEADLVWVGLIGLMDPPRPEAREAVACCHQAGIRVIMVTGDYPDTAVAIAREVGLISSVENHQVVTGQELGLMSDGKLQEILKEKKVFARVPPEHKLRLIDALKAQGEVVAMTGDGVNDALALKRADIGVAMGLTGTEVTKETADMILADDNFATLVAAVAEGRAIFDNIKKYLIFLLSSNLAEILVLTGAFFLGMPLPLIAIQILMVNLTTDGLPALALGVDPKAPDLMTRPPRHPQEKVFNRSVNTLLGVITGYFTIVLIPLFAYYLYWNPAGLPDYASVLVSAQTMIFVSLVLLEMANAFVCCSDHLFLFSVGVFSNRFLVVSVFLSISFTVAVVQWPLLGRLFHTMPLRLTD